MESNVCSVKANQLLSHYDSNNLGEELCLEGAAIIRKTSESDFLFQFLKCNSPELIVADLNDLVFTGKNNIFRVISFQQKDNVNTLIDVGRTDTDGSRIRTTEYSMKYENDSKRMSNIKRDGDNLRTNNDYDDNDSSHYCIQIFQIIDDTEYELFKEATIECKMLSDIILRLNMMTRDHYFGGIYSDLASSHLTEEDNETLVISDEVRTLCIDQSILSTTEPNDLSMTEFRIFQLPEEDDMDSSSDDDDDNAYKKTSKTLKHCSEIVCIFCGTLMEIQLSVNMDMNSDVNDFVIHPYVPLTFENRYIYMCMPCVDNWRIYRISAIQEDQLMIQDERNEEICSICSDTPMDLTICSSCPRSFCSTCLQRVLTSTQIEKLDEINDWQCMCCFNNVTTDSPSLNNNEWCFISKCNRSNKHINKFIDEYIQTKTTNSDNYNNLMPNTDPNINDDFAMSLSSMVKVDTNHEDTSHEGSNIFLTLHNNIITPLNKKIVVKLPQKKDKIAKSLPEKVVNNKRFRSSSSLIVNNGDIHEGDKDIHGDDNHCSNNNDSDNNKKKKADIRVGSRTSSKIITPLNKALSLKTGRFSSRIRVTSGAIKDSNEKLNFLDSNNLIEDSDSRALLPPVDTAVDYVFYFTQYLKDNSNRIEVRNTRLSEDVCFLCKDGGDLYECDHVDKKNTHDHKYCNKVYHNYCLAKMIDNDDKWECPRHSCHYCQSKKVKFVCQYCPVSICNKCPEKFDDEYGMRYYKTIVEYDEMNRNKRSSMDINSYLMINIVCQNCLVMLGSIQDRENLSSSTSFSRSNRTGSNSTSLTTSLKSTSTSILPLLSPIKYFKNLANSINDNINMNCSKNNELSYNKNSMVLDTKVRENSLKKNPTAAISSKKTSGREKSNNNLKYYKTKDDSKKNDDNDNDGTGKNDACDDNDDSNNKCLSDTVYI